MRLFVGLLWAVYKEFTAPFGWPRDLIDTNGTQIYVNESYAAQLEVDPQHVLAFVERWLEQSDYVAEVWNRQELVSSRESTAQLYRHSAVPGKSGDLFIQLEPDCFIGDSSGTGHGSPYQYDRHVPLVFYGAEVVAATLHQPVNTVDIAPTIARFIGLPVPAGLDGRVHSLTRLPDPLPADTTDP